MKNHSANLSDLNAKPHARDAVRALIAERFPAGEPLSRATRLETEFPLLLNPQNAARNLFLELADGSVVASVSYRIFEMRVPHHPENLRVAGIGLVVTDQSHEGRGYASELLAEAERRALSEGAVLAWLWSDHQEFYEKRDYILAGTNCEWTCAPGTLLATPHPGVQRAQSLHEMLALYESLGLGPERKLSDYAPFLQLPNTDFWILEEAGKTLAYAVVGKGRDLRDYLHECVGEVDAARQLLAQIVQASDRTLKIHLPPSAPLVPWLNQHLGRAEHQVLGYAKLLHPPALIAWLQSAEDFPADLRLGLGATQWEVTVRSTGQSIFSSSDASHIVQLFLGPWRLEEMGGLSPELSQHFKSFPPREIYFWALDAV